MPTSTDIARIRTLALVGPATSGKTSLAEALLWKSGATGAPGVVERGTTVSDFDPLEKKAQRSLNSSVLHFTHADVTAHVIDTPGAPDFLGQSLPALEAVETAAIVISATTGVEPMAARMMNWAKDRERDRIIVVNKIDAQGVNLEAIVAQIQEAFGKECLPVNLPAGDGLRVLDCFWDRGATSEATDFSSVAKAHSASIAAFVSPNTGPIGYVVEGSLRLLNRPADVLKVYVPQGAPEPTIGLVTVTLGDDGTVLKAIGDAVDGLVVAAFGAGHVPVAMVEPLTALAQRMPVILASRTGAGPVLAETYGFPGSEQDLLRRGLIGAGFLSPVKARILLRQLLAARAGTDDIRKAFTGEE